MFTLSAATVTALIALAQRAASAPVDPAPLVKRATGAQISSSPDFCIGVELLSNGARVTDKNCTTFNPSSTPPFYNKWDIVPGNNQVVRLSGLPPGSGDWCLDSGDSVGSYPPAKIWTCYPGLPAQQWYYTDDKHLAVTNGDRCLESGRYGLTYNLCAASSNAGTQVWNIVGGTTPPPPQGKPIKWTLNGQEKCLTVANGNFVNGAALTINDCFASSSPYYPFQQFIYNTGRTTIRVASSPTQTPYCVDFGSTRSTNGVPLKIWQCYTNLPAQQLWITGDNHIAVEGDNQCADVRAESGPKQGTPYGSLKDVQSWQCAGGNQNQIFGF